MCTGQRKRNVNELLSWSLVFIRVRDHLLQSIMRYHKRKKDETKMGKLEKVRYKTAV